MAENKKNKVFENNYGNVDYHQHDLKFNPDPSFLKEDGVDNDVNYKIIYDQIHSLIQNTKFENFNKSDNEGKFKKLNKVDINEVYEYICKNLKKYPRIDIFSLLSDYFDVHYNKFYDSLANHFKNELIDELKKDGKMPKDLGGSLF